MSKTYRDKDDLALGLLKRVINESKLYPDWYKKEGLEYSVESIRERASFRKEGFFFKTCTFEYYWRDLKEAQFIIEEDTYDEMVSLWEDGLLEAEEANSNALELKGRRDLRRLERLARGG